MNDYNVLIKEKADLRRKEIVDMRNSGLTLSDIAKHFNISRTRVYQIEKGDVDRSLRIPISLLIKNIDKLNARVIAAAAGFCAKTVEDMIGKGVLSRHIHKIICVDWSNVENDYHHYLQINQKNIKNNKRLRKITTKVRFAVLSRDKYRCRYCGASSDTVELVVDHIVPFSKGGSCNIENLITSCFECNIGKAASIINIQDIP